MTAFRPRLVLIHGWGPGGSKRSVRVLATALRALDFIVILPSYGRVWTPWKTKFTNRDKAKMWSVRVQPGDVLIGHSNGAKIAWEMTYYTGGKIRKIFLLNPALDRWKIPGPAIARCFVFHNRYDRLTQIASLLPVSDWGDMGNKGYQPQDDNGFGADPRMQNVEIGRGHTPFQDPSVARQYAIMIASLLHSPV